MPGKLDGNEREQPRQAVKADVTGECELQEIPSVNRVRRWRAAWEVGLVFVVFFLQGASPVPEVNEPYYLGKAIHFWNPAWVPNDFFLNSADTHQVFYFTFGWLALFVPPLVLAWVGRLLTWGLLAWAWQRLSFAVVPRPWFAILTAALFVGLLERFHMAGEWVIGGVEAKGFAYVLVFLGVEALVRDRWNRAWLLLGAAAAFHVLVGGWAAVAAGMAWLHSGKERPRLKSMLPALIGGFLLSLPGLVPSLGLTWGVDAETVRQANVIYVFERLSHHLAPTLIPPVFIYRFVGLVAVLGLLDWLLPADPSRRRLRGFTLGVLAIATMGAMIGLWVTDQALAAGLLRFYWFRLSDVVVPLTVSLLIGYGIVQLLASRPRLAKGTLVVAVVLAGIHVGGYAWTRALPTTPKADYGRVVYWPWRDACAWIADSGQIPSDARFITPLMVHTFKWYAGRSEVANWKDIPQDSQSILEWWARVHDIDIGHLGEVDSYMPDSVAELGVDRLRQLGKKYEADYVLTRRTPPLPLEVVYENEVYCVYRLRGKENDE